MKIKTSELTGLALDWSVGEIEFNRLIAQGSRVKQWILDDHVNGLRTDPYSTNWCLGGPIIEREKINVALTSHGYWMATYQYNYADEKRFLSWGDTPLIAVMRCFVAASIGDEVEIPDALIR